MFSRVQIRCPQSTIDRERKTHLNKLSQNHSQNEMRWRENWREDESSEHRNGWRLLRL